MPTIRRPSSARQVVSLESGESAPTSGPFTIGETSQSGPPYPGPPSPGPLPIGAAFALATEGSEGADGPPGVPGPQGATGPAGPAGASGQSLRGPPGWDGEEGPMGMPIPGPMGPQGATGATGATGPAGPIGFGMDGMDGEMGFPIPGPPGASGGGGGSLVLVEAHTASSSSSLNFTTGISSTYDEYVIELINIVPSTTADLGFLMSTNGGSTYDSGANYDSVSAFQWVANQQGTSLNANGFYFRGGTGSTIPTNGSWNGTFRLYNPLSASLWKVLLGDYVWQDNSLGAVLARMGGPYKNTSAVNAFQLIPTTGTLTSGTVRLYGIAH